MNAGRNHGLLDTDFDDTGSRYRAAGIDHEMQVLAARDEVLAQDARNGGGAVLGMAGDADRATAQALDAVVAIFRLHIQQRAGRETRAIHELGRHHRIHPTCEMPRAVFGIQRFGPYFFSPTIQWRPIACPPVGRFEAEQRVADDAITAAVLARCSH